MSELTTARPFITKEDFRHFWKFTAKKQTHAGVYQGQWCVYRPDGIRLVVVGTRKDAQALAWALNYAVVAFKTEGRGDWHTLLAQGEK